MVICGERRGTTLNETKPAESTNKNHLGFPANNDVSEGFPL